MVNKPTVVDIFCGAGGFSEGFRQQNFDIVLGIDSWEPAINTFNNNFGLNCTTKNILDFENSVDEILVIPDSDIIIGSPPCVSFSNSNKSGKADKSMGVRLTEIFLRIVAIKKFKSGSKLSAWFMENVTNSTKYLSRHYTFESLGLSNWATINGYLPKSIALTIDENSTIVNSADFGSPQSRKRVITGEIIKKKKLIFPEKTHGQGMKDSHITLGYVRGNLPRPNCKNNSSQIKDPIYPELQIRLDQLTDHFYDTGLYSTQWENSYYMKRNHPFMGRMSFPENENKSSRTITATNIDTSREAIIYYSEYDRKGDGEFRAPTIREKACLMGFPITYQFLGGGESSKSRLVGNAVCPSVSRAFAKLARKEMGLVAIKKTNLSIDPFIDNVLNLNNFSSRIFNNPPKKKSGARFRRHPFKYGNITVTLSNYEISSNVYDGKWKTSVQYGNGKGFPSSNYQDSYYKEIESVLGEFKNARPFLKTISNGFSKKIGSSQQLQKMHEDQKSFDGFLSPTELIKEVAKTIETQFNSPDSFTQADNDVFKHKKVVPIKQLCALFAINLICSVANKK